MMRMQDGIGALPSQTVWRFFPWFIAGGLAIVAAVNFGMVYTALHTFPGLAGDDGFDLSNHYDRVIDRVAQQSALGWTVTASTDAAGHPRIVLTDRAGKALAGATFKAMAERPVGAPLTETLHFTETAPGEYLGVETLPAKGQWDIQLSASAGADTVSTTKRIVAR